MRRFTVVALVSVGILGLSATLALSQPCVDAEMAFDPGVGSSLDRVTLSASIANTGDEGGLIAVAITVEFNGEIFGPIESHLYLLEGKELGGEIPFLVRPVFPSGTLSITVETSVGECTDTAIASLEIQTEDSVPPQVPDLSSLAASTLLTLTSQPTPVQPTTWGTIKALYY